MLRGLALLSPKSIFSHVDKSEIVTEVRPLQSLKAQSPMDVTLLGIVMDVRFLQPEKAEWPMDVTLLGIVMDVRPVQPEKAE